MKLSYQQVTDLNDAADVLYSFNDGTGSPIDAHSSALAMDGLLIDAEAAGASSDELKNLRAVVALLESCEAGWVDEGDRDAYLAAEHLSEWAQGPIK